MPLPAGSLLERALDLECIKFALGKERKQILFERREVQCWQFFSTWTGHW
jgi:hypothetical protein